jgi:hypothetical protein
MIEKKMFLQEVINIKHSMYIFDFSKRFLENIHGVTYYMYSKQYISQVSNVYNETKLQ